MRRLGTPATGDSFGIMAEQIVRAQIGALVFAFKPGASTPSDFFSAAPTSPGGTSLASDFFIGEIIP